MKRSPPAVATLPWRGFAAAMVLGGLLVPAVGRPQHLTVTALEVRAEAAAPELRCDPARPRARIARAPAADPLELPSDEAVAQTLAGLAASRAADPASPTMGRARALQIGRAGQRLRVGIWGDSHLAAGFFTQELLRLLQLPADRVSTGFIAANVGRAGVRLPLKAACVSQDWRYEPVYLGKDGAAAPGPGMVNLVATQVDASLAWDLRSPIGQARFTSVRVLYQQTAEPITIRLAVDSAAPQVVVLAGPAGPAALDLVAESPISSIALGLVSGALRLHGLQLPPAQAALLELDVFGYPGATVGAWHQANPSYFDAWFPQPSYDLIVLAYGTNEGNVKPFDAAAYETALIRAVRQWRASFPRAVCLLIAPGDRGVRVSRSTKVRRDRASQRSAGQPRAHGAAQSPAGALPDLLRYASIHQDIGRIQSRVAEQMGCHAWSMQDAMGGMGSAYTWARHKPPLMSPDLIHFTVAGYQKLAQLFARDLGWERERLWQGAAAGEPQDP